MRRKISNRFLSFLLAIPLTFSGCASTPRYSSSDQDDSVMKEETLEEGEKKFDYSGYFDSINLLEDDNPLFPTREEIDQFVSEAESLRCSYVFDNNQGALMETVKNNSLEYLESHPEFSSAFVTEVADLDIYSRQLDFELVFGNIVDQLLHCSNYDVSEDLCHMRSLRIVYGSADDCDEKENSNIKKLYDDTGRIVLAYYDDIEELIVLDYDHIMMFCSGDDPIYDNYYQALEFFFGHELNHMRQFVCSCNTEDQESFSILNYFDGYSSFLVESSAESELYNLGKDVNYFEKNTYDYTYFLEREYESLLLLMALFNTEYNIVDYYNSIFNSDIQQLHDFFGLKTEDEVYDFYKIVSAMDGCLWRNPYVFEYYDKDILTYGENKDCVGYDYRVELFNRVLSNMVDYTESHDDFSLEENLILFGIVKGIIVKGCYEVEVIDDPDSSKPFVRVYDPDFVSSFSASDIKYQEFLMDHYKVSNLDSVNYKEYSIDTMIDMMNLMADHYRDSFDSNCSYEISCLMDKFPLLEPILFSLDASFGQYSNFVSDHPEVYQKTK